MDDIPPMDEMDSCSNSSEPIEQQQAELREAEQEEEVGHLAGAVATAASAGLQHLRNSEADSKNKASTSNNSNFSPAFQQPHSSTAATSLNLLSSAASRLDDNIEGADSPMDHSPSSSSLRTAGTQDDDEQNASTMLTSNYEPSEAFLKEHDLCMGYFRSWNEQDQIHFVTDLLKSMCHYQHGSVDAFLKPMLQRDFLTLLPGQGLDHVAESILSYLDAKSLCAAELVCKSWRNVISEGMLWKKLIERKVHTDSLWKGLAERRGWIQYLFIPRPGVAGVDVHKNHQFYRELYPRIIRDIETIEENWRTGRHNLQRINCRSENSKGVYCLQYDDQKIVSGLRDNTIKLWDRNTLNCTRILGGHTGSVLCLQYDDKVIISGSSDATVRVWDVNTGEMVNTLVHHTEAVLHLRFYNGMMVTCSKDGSIAVWDMVSPTEINLRRVLVGHRAAVNVVDFDERYIVSASGDRTIKVWNTSSCEFVRTLNGHKRGIACLQYHDRLVVSGSSDNSIRLWDIESGKSLRELKGHEELVRCIRFDSKRIVSGAYDGKIKVWDLQAALDTRNTTESLCVRTLIEHTGRVFRLQFDEFQIVSGGHDDTILIWDFLSPRKEGENAESGSGGVAPDGANPAANNGQAAVAGGAGGGQVAPFFNPPNF